MNIDIANRLYELRKRYNYSQEELADKIGVSRQAVSKWERAEASPDTDNLILLAKLYNVSLDELLSTSEPVEASLEPTVYVQGENDGNDREDRPGNVWLAFPYPILVTIVYLFIGFGFNLWHPGWILFITIPLYYSVAAYYGNQSKKR
jgi:transcriptional regulator with XRE-family HTH domain